jgi:hypothetical protein
VRAVEVLLGLLVGCKSAQFVGRDLHHYIQL